MDKISIIMPVYNCEKYVSEAIQNMLEQTYTNFELIIVDDGSTDKSLDIIKSFNDPRIIKIISKKNGGTGSALNEGFKYATGKYGTWISADDLKYPIFLEKLYNIITKFEATLAFGSFCEFLDQDAEKTIKEIKLLNIKEDSVVQDFLKISYNFCITGICFLYDMDAKQYCGEFIKDPGEDYVMGVQLGLLGNAVYTPEILGAHRLHKECLTLKKPNCTDNANNMVKKILS